MLRFLSLLILFSSALLSVARPGDPPVSMATPEGIYLKTLQPFDSATNQKIDDYFHRLHSSGHFNGSVILFNDGQVFWNSYGVRDWRTNDSLNLNTSFQLASVSKTITSAAIMILVERGMTALLNLASPVHQSLSSATASRRWMPPGLRTSTFQAGLLIWVRKF